MTDDRAPAPAGLPPLIRSLLEPSRYPHPVQRVQLVETHISWLLLAGAYVYKVKKPLKLPFLDFSTLALRRACCLAEVRLNSRFAPDIYLDVRALLGSAGAPQWAAQPERADTDGAAAPDGPVIEYAVRMRRFDDDQRLDRLCARGELDAPQLSALAREIVRFHEQAERLDPKAPWSTPERVLALALDNFDDLQRHLAPMPAALGAELDALRRWTLAQGAALAPLMARRRAEGHVRECHGDLHLANLVRIDGRVRMFDCIEFNDALRWIDTAAEVAFTTIDLLDHGVPGLAGWFLNEVLEAGGDHEAAPLLRFYAVYRALVRAKVAALRDAQAAAPGTQARHDEALGYLAQARALAHPARPRLVITHGLSGCGKTVASGALVLGDPHGQLLRLRADVERKRLFGLAPLAASGSAQGQGIYTREANARTYDHLAERARGLLQAGWSVVVDGAFLRRDERARFQALAQACAADFAILAPQAPLEELRARILRRQSEGRDASEATLAVLDFQCTVLEPLDEAERALRLAG